MLVRPTDTPATLTGFQRFDAEGYPELGAEIVTRAAEIATALNGQLRLFQPEEIATLLGSLAENRGIDLAKIENVAIATSHFGKPENLHALNSTVKDLSAKGFKLFVPQAGSLADCLFYLSTRKQFFGTDVALQNEEITHEIDGKSIILLDYYLVERIKADRNFASLFIDRQAEIVIVDPIGLSDGLSIFTISGPRSLKDKLNELLDEIPYEDMGDTVSVERFLQQRGANLLESAFNSHGFSRKQLPPMLPMTGDVFRDVQKLSPSATVAHALNPNAMPPEKLADIVIAQSSADPKLQELLFQYLGEGIQYFSPRVMISRLRELGEEVHQIAAHYGVGHKDIVFVTPEGGRSHDAITFAFRVVNRYMSNPCVSMKKFNGEELKAQGFFDGNKLFVCVDDLAVTGTTARKNYGMMRERIPYECPVVLGYVASTPRAYFEASSSLQAETDNSPLTSSISSLSELNKRDPQFHYVAVQPLVGFEELRVFNSSSPEEREKLRQRLGTPGYGGLNIAAAQWYMIPNTCPSFVAEEVLTIFCPRTALKEQRLRMRDFISFRNAQLAWAEEVSENFVGSSSSDLAPLVKNLQTLMEISRKRFPTLLGDDQRRLCEGVIWLFDELKLEEAKRINE